MYHHTKYEVSMSRHSKVIGQTDRQTDTHTRYENITFPHTRAVIKGTFLGVVVMVWPFRSESTERI